MSVCGEVQMGRICSMLTDYKYTTSRGKSEGKRLFGNPSHRWGDNI
jgi:hypothetical protein